MSRFKSLALRVSVVWLGTLYLSRNHNNHHALAFVHHQRPLRTSTTLPSSLVVTHMMNFQQPSPSEMIVTLASSTTQHKPSSSSYMSSLLEEQQQQHYGSTNHHPSSSFLLQGMRQFLVDAATHPPVANAADITPSDSDIKLLREAMAMFYNQNPNYVKAKELLSKTLVVWKDQPADEVAALYRIRGDCNMQLLKPMEAQEDYTKAIVLLETPDGLEDADPSERPAAYLGRGRSIRARSNNKDVTPELWTQAANDYQMSLRLSSREEWDTNQELEEDGASRNPYATWEWGSSLRSGGKFKEAARIHLLASQSFAEIGDRARSVISLLDAGIDYACMDGSNSKSENNRAKSTLTKAIKQTTSVEGRDVDLLQRVVAKEGEGRMALASILWANGDRGEAEMQYIQGCNRLEQLEMDAVQRVFKKSSAKNNDDGGKGEEERSGVAKLAFSIDDQVGAFDVSCEKFRNEDYLKDKLGWPASLRQKFIKFANFDK